MSNNPSLTININKIEQPNPQSKPVNLKKKPAPIESKRFTLSMKIYGGFMFAMGTAAVALSIALLIGASLGTAGLIALGAGCTVILGGMGLFAITHKKQKANPEVLNNSSLLQNSSST